MKVLWFASLICLICALISSAQPADQLKRARELFNQGVKFQEARQWDKAIDRYNDYVKIRPERANVYFNRGLCYHQKNEFDKAIADFSRSISIDPKGSDVWFSRAQSYFVKRVLDPVKYSNLAMADLDQAIKITPTYAGAYLLRGQAKAEKGSDDQAMADYNRSIQLDPKNADAFYRRGNLQSKLNNYSAAATDFREALRLDPKHPYAKTWLDFANGKITPTKPVTPPPAVVLGWAAEAEAGKKYLAQNDPKNAITSLKHALSLAPTKYTGSTDRLFIELAKAKINEDLARAYKLTNYTDLAIEHYTAAQEPLLEALTASVQERQLAPRKTGSVIILELVKVNTDADIVLYSILMPAASELVEIGRRALDAFPSNSIDQKQTMKVLQIGILKVLSAELAAEIFLTTSSLRSLQADLCRGKSASLCGAGSPKNEVAAYADAALRDINQAISIAPTLQRLYLHRAKVYRFLGQVNLAIADEAKAAQLKE